MQPIPRTTHTAAVSSSTLNDLREFLRSGIDVNSPMKDGSIALHKASKGGYCDIVEELLKKGALIDTKDDEGRWTALHLAAERGHTDTALKLAELGGASLIGAVDKNGMTALHYAAFNGYTNTALKLAELGGVSLVNAKDEDGWTALHWAAKRDHTDTALKLAELLRRAEADLKKAAPKGSVVAAALNTALKNPASKDSGFSR